MINVTCAIIRNDEENVLIVQRGAETDHPFKWEFPGGKVAPGETPEACVAREIEEELSMDIVIISSLPVVEHDYGFKQVRLIPFICDTLDELPFLSEHLAYRWVTDGELSTVDFSEADISVAGNYLEKRGREYTLPVQNDNKMETESSYDEELQSMVNSIMGLKEAAWVATSAIENPAIFDKLIEYSFSDDKKLAFRASWALTKVCDKYPEIINPRLDKLIGRLGRLENESARRSFLRIISLTEIESISEKQHGILADYCFGLLRSGFSSVAVKVYSMEILYKLVLKYPELQNELAVSINMLQTEGSPGILARGRHILKKLAGI